MDASELGKTRNPKHETRNKRQIQMLEITNKEVGVAKFPDAPGRVDGSCFEFVFSGFEFVSDFEPRISNFGNLAAPRKTASA
jgi:hypothetical protein